MVSEQAKAYLVQSVKKTRIAIEVYPLLLNADMNFDRMLIS